MSNYKIQYRSKISRKDSQEMILMMAKYGNSGFKHKLNSDADVKRFLVSKNIDFNKLVEHCRTFSNKIPEIENLIGSTVSTFGGGKISIIDKKTGKEIESVNHPGTLSTSTYWTLFEQSINYKNNAVNKSSFSEFQASIVNGIASIESFINLLADEWNDSNPNDILRDTKQNKISFDEKMDFWLPKLSGGTKLDKGKRFWSDYIHLKNIRDDLTIHSKKRFLSFPLEELASNINLMKSGISELLIQLHLLMKRVIPAIIIRSRFSPLVEIVEIKSN